MYLTEDGSAPMLVCSGGWEGLQATSVVTALQQDGAPHNVPNFNARLPHQRFFRWLWRGKSPQLMMQCTSEAMCVAFGMNEPVACDAREGWLATIGSAAPPRPSITASHDGAGVGFLVVFLHLYGPWKIAVHPVVRAFRLTRPWGPW